MDCLKRKANVFAWSIEDVEGIPTDLSLHHLNANPKLKLVTQKKRNFAPEQNRLIKIEADLLLTAKHVRPVQCPKWLSNVAIIPNPGKNGDYVSTSLTLIALAVRTPSPSLELIYRWIAPLGAKYSVY